MPFLKLLDWIKYVFLKLITWNVVYFILSHAKFNINSLKFLKSSFFYAETLLYLFRSSDLSIFLVF